MNIKKLIILSSITLIAASVSQAQTNTPPTTNMSNLSKLTGDFKQVFLDGYHALKDANFDNGITVEPFGLYHAGDFGGGLAVTTAKTNGLNVGFGLATIHNTQTKKFDFYDASLGLSLGSSFTLPVLNWSVYAYIETGPAVNLAHPTDVLEQSIAGFKVFFLQRKLAFGAGVGHNSEWPTDAFYIAHIGYSFK